MVEPSEELWAYSGKVYKSIPELVDLLRSRGLAIDVDDTTVEQFLTGVNYYRFTGYALRNRCAHHSRMYDLPWGQNDEPKDIDIGSEEERRRRRLYIFSELPEWTKLKQVGVEIPYFRPLFFQLALVYRFLKATPRAVYDCQEWRKRVSEFLQNVPQVQARGVNFRALLHVPNDPITSKIWRFDD